MNIYEQLLDCWKAKNEIKFFELLSDLSDTQIDELLEFYQDMPDKMRTLLVYFEYERANILNKTI